MHHLLSPLFSDMELESISGNVHLMTEIASEKEKSSDRVAIGVRHVGNRDYVSLRNEQHVDASFRVDIVDHDVVLILVYRNRWNLMRDNGAKNTHKHEINK